MSAGAAGGAAAAAAIAAQQQRIAQNEEESMTPYDSNELDGWEFKIIRSSTGRFKKPEFLREILDEEARAGWKLLEKFDDARIRLKRRVDAREHDRGLAVDPYRTYVGTTPTKQAVIIVAVIAALIVIFGIAINLSQ